MLLIPGDSGEIRAQRGSGAWAWWAAASVLSFKPDDARSPNALPILAWSGSLGELEGDSLFDDNPRTWGPKGWLALEHASTRLLGLGLKLILRPHHRHVISDIPSCKRLLECDWAAGGVRLAYDPLAMCTEAMLASPKLNDHLHRMFEASGTFAAGGLAAVVLPSNHAERPLLAELLDAHVSPDIPCLLSPSAA